MAGASAKELGNGLIFLKKASGRARIDLLVALSNCADEAQRPHVAMSDLPQDRNRVNRWDVKGEGFSFGFVPRRTRWRVMGRR